MDLLKKVFPFSFKANDVASLVVTIIIYLVVGLVIGFALGLVGWIIPLGLIDMVLGLIGSIVELYILAGIVIAVLVFTKVLKD